MTYRHLANLSFKLKRLTFLHIVQLYSRSIRDIFYQLYANTLQQILGKWAVPDTAPPIPDS